MDTRHTLYKTDHRYNPKKCETITKYRSPNLPATAATAAATTDAHLHHPEAHAARGPSFRNEINHVLQQWRQLQGEKKQQQQQQQSQLLIKAKQHQECEEFDRIMEEVLANQLKALEQQEEEEEEQQQHLLGMEPKQSQGDEQFARIMEEDLTNQLKELEEREEVEEEYKRMEQMVEEQLKLDDSHQPMAQFTQDFIGRVEAQKFHQKQLFHRLQRANARLDAWKAKNDRLVELVMKMAAAAPTAHPIKTNKLLNLVKIPGQAKTYHVQKPK